MDAKQSLSKKSHQSISFLFKQYLMLIEDLKFEHDQYVRKLKNVIPEPYHIVIDTAEHFDQARMAWMRKRVLDLGNETLRSLDSELSDFSVSFVFKN